MFINVCLGWFSSSDWLCLVVINCLFVISFFVLFSFVSSSNLFGLVAIPCLYNLFLCVCLFCFV